MSQCQSPPASTNIPTKAIFRYCEPDRSVPASERSLFAQPKPINLHEETLPLHNYRTATHLERGPAGLDKHGFTLVIEEDRDSDIDIDTDAAGWWSDETALRKTYIPAVEALVRRVTGCRVAVVNNVAFRRRGGSRYDGEEGTKYYHPRGGELDRMIEKLDCDVPMSKCDERVRGSVS
jgi:GA4 desaturase